MYTYPTSEFLRNNFNEISRFSPPFVHPSIPSSASRRPSFLIFPKITWQRGMLVAVLGTVASKIPLTVRGEKAPGSRVRFNRVFTRSWKVRPTSYCATASEEKHTASSLLVTGSRNTWRHVIFLHEELARLESMERAIV